MRDSCYIYPIIYSYYIFFLYILIFREFAVPFLTVVAAGGGTKEMVNLLLFTPYLPFQIVRM
jgi:hypothetical protein